MLVMKVFLSDISYVSYNGNIHTGIKIIYKIVLKQKHLGRPLLLVKLTRQSFRYIVLWCLLFGNVGANRFNLQFSMFFIVCTTKFWATPKREDELICYLEWGPCLL